MDDNALPGQKIQGALTGVDGSSDQKIVIKKTAKKKTKN
jgi:hypothetical protein